MNKLKLFIICVLMVIAGILLDIKTFIAGICFLMAERLLDKETK